MAKKTKAELKAKLDSIVKQNGNGEITPAKHNSIETDEIDSFVSAADGGMVIDALLGYTTELTPTDPKHLTQKKYVDDAAAILQEQIDSFSGGFDSTADQNITGSWEFTLPVVIPDGVEADEAVNKGQLDAKEDSDNKATDFSSINNTKFPTTQAVETRIDTKVTAAVVGLLDDRGNYDASTNLFPSSGGSGTSSAILKGDLWEISVAGTLGGQAVTSGDWVRALVDTPGQTSGNWSISEKNIGYVPEPSLDAGMVPVTLTANQSSYAIDADNLKNRTFKFSINAAFSITSFANMKDGDELTLIVFKTVAGDLPMTFFSGCIVPGATALVFTLTGSASSRFMFGVKRDGSEYYVVNKTMVV